MANQTFNASSEDFGIGTPYPEPLRIILINLHILVIVSGVPGNWLTIFAIFRFKNLRIPINMFIANLAVADSVLVGYVLPFTLADLIRGIYPVGHTWCLFNVPVTQTAFSASFCSITAIAISRYLKMCKTHLFNKILGWKGTLLVCLLSWLIGPIMSIYMMVNQDMGYNKAGRICMVNSSDSGAFTWTSLLLKFPPAYIIMWCYWKIWKQVKQSDRDIRNHGNETFSRIRHNIDRQHFQRNLLVFLLYILLQTPFEVLHMVAPDAQVTVHGVCLFLFFVNSSISSIIYGAMNTNIRRHYQHLLPHVRRKSFFAENHTEVSRNINLRNIS